MSIIHLYKKVNFVKNVTYEVLSRQRRYIFIINIIQKVHLTYKMRYVSLFVCMQAMAGRTAGPIKTKLGIGTHVDPGSVLVKVKLKVI